MYTTDDVIHTKLKPARTADRIGNTDGVAEADRLVITCKKCDENMEIYLPVYSSTIESMLLEHKHGNTYCFVETEVQNQVDLDELDFKIRI